MKKIKLTQDREALVDDRDFEYLNQWKWCVYPHRNGTFYARRAIRKNGKWTTIKMHQVLAELMGFKHRADHKNRNGLDNQRHNLRDATNKQNAENQGTRKNNKSGHNGVDWYRSKWRARIHHNGKKIDLGSFRDIQDAVKARREGEKKYFTHAAPDQDHLSAKSSPGEGF